MVFTPFFVGFSPPLVVMQAQCGSVKNKIKKEMRWELLSKASQKMAWRTMGRKAADVSGFDSAEKCCNIAAGNCAVSHFGITTSDLAWCVSNEIWY